MSLQPGIEVPIGGIERELGNLWEKSGGKKTRASLINLAIYSERKDSLESNSAIIEGIAGEHAMRSLLIEADPEAAGSSAESWISMHCYARGPMGGGVCSEQICFRLSGEAARSLQSVVFSHLDSDLPLALWWQADFRTPINARLWRWVDRLLFDSRQWLHPGKQFEIVSEIADLADTRTVLCDLNWARSLPVRQTLAGIFDPPCTLRELYKVEALEFDHAPGSRTTALLMLGWLADRLDWTLVKAEANPVFRNSLGQLLTVVIREIPGNSISRILLRSKDACFELSRKEGSDVFVTSVKDKSLSTSSRMVMTLRDETGDILLAELARGGRHPLYCKAVQAVQQLWD